MSFATALKAGGGLLSTFGALGAGDASMAEARYNARIFRQQAQAEERRTQIAQSLDFRRGQQIMGQLRARLGHSGARMDVGAPIAIQADQAVALAYENAVVGAEGRVRAEQARSQAAMALARGRNLKTASRYQAFGSLLGTVGEMEESGMFEPVKKYAKKVFA